MTIEDCIDSACVFRWLDRRGQGAEPSGQHLLPLETHLPRAAFVGEKDYVVFALVDMIEQAKNDLKYLAHFGGVAFRRLLCATVEETTAIGYHGGSPDDFASARN
jgi:hypothetical protein